MEASAALNTAVDRSVEGQEVNTVVIYRIAGFCRARRF